MVEVRRSVCALDCPDCCSLLINGVPDNTDYAPAGDRHNVDCLRVLVNDYPSHAPPPPPRYQPPPLLRAS